VQTLIDNKAEVNAASKSGFNALVFAAIKNDPKSVRELLASGADANFALPDGTKVLLAAAASKSTLAAAALVDGGASPNVADRGGNTPLHTAAQSGDIELVKTLLAKGADPNARTNKAPAGGGRGGGGGGFRPVAGELTPLMVAAKANHPDIVTALVAAGADPKLKAQDGSTLLMSAVGSGHVEVVKVAYELDPDVKVVTSTGATLMHASVTGTMASSTQPEICKVIQFLADKGAALDEKDGRGKTPMDLATPLPIDQAVDLFEKLIIASGSTPKSPFKR
jgi:ankyrin repeat protein